MNAYIHRGYKVGAPARSATDGRYPVGVYHTSVAYCILNIIKIPFFSAPKI